MGRRLPIARRRKDGPPPPQPVLAIVRAFATFTLFTGLPAMGGCHDPDADMPSLAPQDETGEDAESPMRTPLPVAGVYIAIADHDVVPRSFEILDENERHIVGGDKPVVLLLTIDALPFRFALRPIDDDNADVRLDAIVSHPGCHGIVIVARTEPQREAAPSRQVGYVPRLVPPLDATRWLLHLGSDPLTVREDGDDAPPLLELSPGQEVALDDPTPRWLRIEGASLSAPARWWALEASHTLLVPGADARVRYLEIAGSTECTIVGGGVAEDLP